MTYVYNGYSLWSYVVFFFLACYISPAATVVYSLKSTNKLNFINHTKTFHTINTISDVCINGDCYVNIIVLLTNLFYTIA